jgi:transcriptional antiterminator
VTSTPTLKIRVKFITSITATSIAPVTPRTTPNECQEEHIKLALAKQYKENVPFNQLALKFNVPQTTLQD